MNIELSDIGKRYNSNWIFKSINISIESSQSIAIIGKNGSGKSTLLKIIASYVNPSKGKIKHTNVSGTIANEELYKKVSFTGPYLELIEELTLQECLEFHAQTKGFQQGWSIPSLIELLDMDFDKDKTIKQFSSGMKQRLKLVLAILSPSEVLLLDEPTSNLDHEKIHWFKKLLTEQLGSRTLVIASNEVEDEMFLCKQRLDLNKYKS